MHISIKEQKSISILLILWMKNIIFSEVFLFVLFIPTHNVWQVCHEKYRGNNKVLMKQMFYPPLLNICYFFTMMSFLLLDVVRWGRSYLVRGM